MRNTYLEPAWWLHHPRRRCGKQCVIVCREIHNRALCFTERGSTWPLRHIQPEETVRRDSVLRHTQHHLSGSLLHVVLNLLISQRGSHLCPSLSLSLSFTSPWFVFVGVSWRGGEGAVFPSLPVGGLWLRSTEAMSLHHPYRLHPTMCTGGCTHPLAQPDLLP